MTVLIDLAAIDPGARDPFSILGKNTGDLVNINFFQSPLPPEPVDLCRDLQCLLAYHECIEFGVERGTIPVVERLD